MTMTGCVIVCCLVLGLSAHLLGVYGSTSAAAALSHSNRESPCTSKLTNNSLQQTQITIMGAIRSSLNSSSPGEERGTWRERSLLLREGMLNNRERVQDTKDDLLTVREQLQETKEDILLIKRQLQDSTEDSATQAQLQNISTALEQTRAQLQATNSALQVVTAPSSTFVRWGRTNCTSNSQLVYSGDVGGSWYTHPGAAVNPLCLTQSPQFDDEPLTSYKSYLYGAEYELIPNHHNQDVPCAVCRVQMSTTIMIPGTKTCPQGWTSQYSGHLVAGHYNHAAASEYLCLDGEPESAHSGHGDQNGYLLYYTVTVCGSLPCPPYTANKVATCVVCSK